jgi:isopentenyldiphosphate isomerase/NTP pyrophosphatase (non-canonical NTP hydrolase)
MTEYVDIVDENDNFVKTVSREESDAKLLRRRAARVTIFNSKGKFFIQKRSAKVKNYPNLWDFGVTETMSHGESYEAAAIRGLKEELGILTDATKLQPLFKVPYTNSDIKRMYMVFQITYNGKYKLDKDEVASAKFVSRKLMESMMKNGLFALPSVVMYDKLVQSSGSSDRLDKLKQLIITSEKSIQLDPWSGTQGVAGYCDEIKKEAEEAIEAARKKDYANLREELGDVLIDWCHACLQAEQAGLFTMADVIKDADDKLHRRKPYLKENRKVELDEAKALWKNAKEIEKAKLAEKARQEKL